MKRSIFLPIPFNFALICVFLFSVSGFAISPPQPCNDYSDPNWQQHYQEPVETCIKVRVINEEKGKVNAYLYDSWNGTSNKKEDINKEICIGGKDDYDWCRRSLQLTIIPNEGYKAFVNGYRLDDYEYKIPNNGINQEIEISFEPTDIAACPDIITNINIEIINEENGTIQHNGNVDNNGNVYLSDGCQWLEIEITPDEGYIAFINYDNEYYMHNIFTSNDKFYIKGDGETKNFGVLFLPQNHECAYEFIDGSHILTLFTAVNINIIGEENGTLEYNGEIISNGKIYRDENNYCDNTPIELKITPNEGYSAYSYGKKIDADKLFNVWNEKNVEIVFEKDIECIQQPATISLDIINKNGGNYVACKKLDANGALYEYINTEQNESFILNNECQWLEFTIIPKKGYTANVNGEIFSGDKYVVNSSLQNNNITIEFKEECSENNPLEINLLVIGNGNVEGKLTTADYKQESVDLSSNKVMFNAACQNLELNLLPEKGNTVFINGSKHGSNYYTINESSKILIDRQGKNFVDIRFVPDESVSIKKAIQSDKKHGIVIPKNPTKSEAAEMRVILPEIMTVRILIYDNLGNLVFDEQNSDAKEYKFFWNLTNLQGRKVTNGSYLVVAEAKNKNGEVYRYSNKLGVKK